MDRNMPKRKIKKIRTDLTGRHDVKVDEIIKALTPKKPKKNKGKK